MSSLVGAQLGSPCPWGLVGPWRGRWVRTLATPSEGGFSSGRSLAGTDDQGVRPGLLCPVLSLDSRQDAQAHVVPGLSAVEEAGRGARAPGGLGSRAASSSSGCGLMSISSSRSCWPRLWTEQVCSQPRAAMSSYVWGHSWWLGPCLKPCPLLWQHGLRCFLSRVWQGP